MPAPTPIPPPIASFSLDASGERAPVNIQFSDTSQGPVTTWEWDFGGGASSTEGNPTYEYTKAGSYTVQLKVSGPGGSDTATLAEPVKVTPGLLHRVTLEPASPRVEVTKEQPFTAQAFDQFDNPIPGLNFTFRAAEGTGSVRDDGVFIAGRTAAHYVDALTVDVRQGSTIRTATVDMTVTPGPLQRVYVEPQIAILRVDEEVQFTARAVDLFENEILGLSIDWHGGSAGTIDNTGRFVAGRVGVHRDDVRAAAVQNMRVAEGFSTLTVQPVILSPIERYDHPLTRIAQAASSRSIPGFITGAGNTLLIVEMEFRQGLRIPSWVGVRIFDISNPEQPREIVFLDFEQLGGGGEVEDA